MSELPVIPDINDPNRIGETAVKPNSMTCAGGCQNHGTLSTVFYTPVVLICSGLVALATFPEIAEYATPWIGEPVSQHVCPSVCGTSASSNQCGSMNGCSNTSCSASGDAGAGDCEHSVLSETSDAIKTSKELNSMEDIECSSDATHAESPADALSSENTEPTTDASN